LGAARGRLSGGYLGRPGRDWSEAGLARSPL